jgi:hypothetical protein
MFITHDGPQWDDYIEAWTDKPKWDTHSKQFYLYDGQYLGHVSPQLLKTLRPGIVLPKPGECIEIKDICTWTEDEEGRWYSDCDGSFEFNLGGPFDNKMKFCGYCGRPLSEKKYKEPKP